MTGARSEPQQGDNLEQFYAELALNFDPPDGISPTLLLYRELIRGSFEKAIAAVMPETVRRMGPTFPELLRNYLASSPRSSRYLREVAMEFLVFAKGQMQLEVPTYLLELAELEAARVWVAAAEVSKVMESSQLDLESGLVFWEAARVLRFEYPVHRLPLETDQQQHFMGVEGAKTQGEPALEPSPTRLMAYRDDEYRVRYLELSAYAADLIDRLMVGAPLGAAIISVCREHGQAPTQEFMESCASLLSNLAERGIIVGVSPTSACP